MSVEFNEVQTRLVHDHTVVVLLSKTNDFEGSQDSQRTSII